MKQEQIIALAKQAGFPWAKHPKVLERLTKFCELVSLAEREACLKLCEEIESETWVQYNVTNSPHTEGVSDGASRCIEAIRTRGNT